MVSCIPCSLSPRFHVLCIKEQPAFPKGTKREALPHRQDASVCAAGSCDVSMRALSPVVGGRAFLPEPQWKTLAKSKRHALPHRALFCCPSPCVEAPPVLPHQMHQPQAQGPSCRCLSVRSCPLVGGTPNVSVPHWILPGHFTIYLLQSGFLNSLPPPIF